MEAPAERPKKQKRSLILDVDQIAWLEAKAKAVDVSDSYIARQVIRAAMDAEQRHENGAAA